MTLLDIASMPSQYDTTCTFIYIIHGNIEHAWNSPLDITHITHPLNIRLRYQYSLFIDR